MFSKDIEIANSVQSNCLLLNDALEIELRRIHNEEEVLIDEQCIDLIKVAARYTELFLSFSESREIPNADTVI